MQNEVGFDYISDLFLSPDESFNWENKATSLYCIVAGNISSDLRTLYQTLAHLSKHYQGVFYIPGILEYETTDSITIRTEEIISIVSNIKNVCLLHQHVAIVDGIAIVGINGWSNAGDTFTTQRLFETASRHDDFNYLYLALGKLQRHLDVKNIIVVSNAVPKNELYFGERPIKSDDQVPLCATLANDTEHKVTHWVFGTYEKGADTMSENINFINNPYLHQKPYWPKRITISI